MNIIKDNRIVFSHTFATRFLSYLAKHFDETSGLHPMWEEEYEYMVAVAVELLKYQIKTCPPEEEWYFKNLYKDYKDYKDIIKHHICANNPEFYEYLKRTKLI